MERMTYWTRPDIRKGATLFDCRGWRLSDVFDKLAEYEDLEERGLLVKPHDGSGEEMTKLKRCPFCGNEASVGNTRIHAFVYCTACNAQSGYYSDYSWELAIEDAIRAWNCREKRVYYASDLEGETMIKMVEEDEK